VRKREGDSLRVREKAGEVPRGHDGGVGCSGYFPGDGLAGDGKRKDADYAHSVLL